MLSASSARAHTLGAAHFQRAGIRSQRRGDFAIAAACVGVLTLLSIWWKSAVAHWFLIPVMACGILAGVDVVRWLRGRLDLFDPRTIIACLAFYGLFVAPILNVAWDRFGVGYDLLLFGDWRPWLGFMATLDAAGLVAYRIAHNWVFASTEPSPTRWEINRKRFYPVFGVALLTSVAGVTAYLWQLGGILGEVEAYEGNQAAFVGKGWLVMLAWPLAILSFIVLVVTWTEYQKKIRHGLMIGILLLSIAGIGHFVLMGWHGSRSATIWALFWMAGIVHYRFRKLSPKMMAVGVVFSVAFMYFYGFYKERGRAGLEVLSSPSAWLEPKGYQRDLKGLLLSDLARADSAAFILHNLVTDPGDYNYRLGLTYVGAFAILIPRNIWPDRPEFKTDAGTEAQLGKWTPWLSLRVYGLAGEAMLNFGPAGVVPAFAIYGGLLGWYRRRFKSWDSSDARMFLVPFWAVLFASAFVSDSDNLVSAAVTHGAIVSTALFAASKRFSATRSSTRYASFDHR